MIPYQLNQPDQIIDLPNELREISGLSWFDQSTLICHHDEAGIIYFIDIPSEKIKGKISFKKNGDFEGIERVGNHVWMVLGNGTLYRIEIDKKKKENNKIYKTNLSSRNDVEGLAYDSLTESLLLACKERPGLSKNDYAGKRAIYAFDLKQKILVSEPVYLIELTEIYDRIQLNPVEKWSVKILNVFRDRHDHFIFKPSGIAVHPVTHHIYVISSRVGALAVLDRKGKLLQAVPLDPDLFNKPEGICFDPSGTLYISNEGHKQGGTIIKFNPPNNEK